MKRYYVAASLYLMFLALFIALLIQVVRTAKNIQLVPVMPVPYSERMEV